MKYRNTMIIATIFVVAVLGGFVWSTYTGEAMKASKSFIRSSPDIVEVVGNIQDISAGMLCCQWRIVGPTGWAKYELNVHGRKGDVTVFVELERVLGVWQVKSARLRTPVGRIKTLAVTNTDEEP